MEMLSSAVTFMLWCACMLWQGPPVMNEEERYDVVEAVKWVDEIITGKRMLEHMLP